MNKVILMGRLTRDPEVRYSQGANATAVCRYTLAVDRRFKREGQPDADFINCTVFGKGAEFAEKYFRQGTKIAVTGSLQQDNYTNKNGEKVYSFQVIIDEQEFAESKNASGAAGSNNGGFTNARPVNNGGSGDFMNIPDGIEDELPFN